MATAVLRILVGLLWIYNVAWKRPPDFGQISGNGLYGFTKDAVDHPVFAPYSWVVEHLVLPHFAVFGWGVLVLETALAVLLLTGAYVRIAAALGIVQSLAIGLSVAQTPGEWPWSYWMMVGIHIVLLFSAAGEVLAVDAARAGRGHRVLADVWGGSLLLAGAWALVASIGDDVFAASGARLGGSGLSVSLGSYNLAGAIALLLCGAGLLAAGGTGRSAPAGVAAVVGVLAALLLYLQLGFSEPWLGGTNTSAALFLCAAMVGGTTLLAGSPDRTPRPASERAPA